MATILTKLEGLDGTVEFAGERGWIECHGMRHAIKLPLVNDAQRTQGPSVHGAVQLIHWIDVASPGLRVAVGAGKQFNQVPVIRLQMLGGALREVERWTLYEVYVTRVDFETPVDRATGLPGDGIDEIFALEYAAIRWRAWKYEDGIQSGSVESGWSSSEQTELF
jgi:type VI secretion system Hcp family effector